VKGLLGWLIAEGDRDPATISDRVWARPDRFELLALASIALILVLALQYPGSGIDWEIYAGAADGTFTGAAGLGYYYAYWLLPIFDVYALAGTVVGGLLWSFTNVAGVWFAARVFGARPVVVLAGFAGLSGFYTGTITGVAIGAVAGVWWAAHEQRWTLLGALSLVAVAKPQWGVPLTLIIVLQAAPPWRGWVRMAVAPTLAMAASLVAFGWWPADIIQRASDHPPAGNASLWFFLGPVVLVLWIPTVLPMKASRRLALVAATALMAVPYVQQYDYVVLWVLATDGIGLLAYLHGPLDSVVGQEKARALQTLMPLAAYVLLVVDPLRTSVRTFTRSVRVSSISPRSSAK
jgi:hypothetical protein